MNRNEAPLRGMRLLLVTVFLLCRLPASGAEGWARHELSRGVGSRQNQTRGVTAPRPLHVEQPKDHLRPSRRQRRSGGVLMLRSASARRSVVPVPKNLPEVVHQKNPGNKTYPLGAPLYSKQRRLDELHPAKQQGKQRKKPVSTTMWCTIILIGTFIVLSAVLKILQTLNYFKIIDRKREEKCWGNVEGSVVFVPMLCILFLATRLQAFQYCRGDPDLFGLPQWWVKYAMVTSTVAVLLSVAVHIFYEACSEYQERAQRRECLKVFSCVLRLCTRLALGTIYACFTIVCLGVIFMEPPSNFLVQGRHSYINPAVICTVFLSVVYFAVFLSLICVKKANEFGLLGQRLRFCQAQEYLRSTISIVAAFAPMLCVLFIGTRIRTSQLDPLHGNPEPWVQLLFYGCSGFFVLHTALAVVSTYVDLHEQRGDGTGQYNTGIRTSASILEVLKLFLVVLITAGVLAVIVRYFTYVFDDAGRRPFAYTLQFTALLTALYFLVNLFHTMVVTAQKTSNGGGDALPKLEVYVRHARDSLELCPKFCILFLGTFMRAMHLTDGRGAPSWGCQLSQLFATASIVILAFVRGIPLVKNRHTNTCNRTVNVLCCVAYLCALHQVIVLLFWMDPTSATGPGTAPGYKPVL